jgi:hypothetical protein
MAKAMVTLVLVRPEGIVAKGRDRCALCYKADESADESKK